MKKEDLRERQALERTVDRIDRDVDAAVVEGTADLRVLERLGMDSRILRCAERSTEDLAEDIERAADTVAVLTDFDGHGEKLNQELEHELQGRVDVIRAAREELKAEMTAQGRMAVEDARPLLESNQERFVDAALSRLYTF